MSIYFWRSISHSALEHGVFSFICAVSQAHFRNNLIFAIGAKSLWSANNWSREQLPFLGKRCLALSRNWPRENGSQAPDCVKNAKKMSLALFFILLNVASYSSGISQCPSPGCMLERRRSTSPCVNYVTRCAAWNALLAVRRQSLFCQKPERCGAVTGSQLTRSQLPRHRIYLRLWSRALRIPDKGASKQWQQLHVSPTQLFPAVSPSLGCQSSAKTVFFRAR